ncbi:MAG TPA: GNAT family protein [Vicinamibacterales bacterium]
MAPDLNALGQPIGRPVGDWVAPVAPSRESTAMSGRYCRVEILNPDRHARDLFDANTADADGRMWTYLPYGPFDRYDDYASWVRTVCAKQDPLFHAIVDLATNRAIGVASYLRIDPEAGSIEVGHIAYSPSLQHTTAATEAMYLMMQRAFELGYRRYEWKCDSLNAASRAAAQRLGFSYEGVFRQARVTKGRNRDTAWFAVVDAEWPALDDAYRGWLDPSNFDADGRQRVGLSSLTQPILFKKDPAAAHAAER